MILRIALPVPLRRCFDYLYESDDIPVPGCRVEVPFRNRSMIGILIEIAEISSFPIEKLKYATAILDQQPLLHKKDIQLYTWISQYYQQPIGEVMLTALPSRLRKGHDAKSNLKPIWFLSGDGKQLTPQHFTRAKKQLAMFECLLATTHGCDDITLGEITPGWKQMIKKFEDQHWVSSQWVDPLTAEKDDVPNNYDIQLNDEQHAAVETIKAAFFKFQVFLLDGITGSGKTEVYIALIRRCIQQNKQILVLAPEISLTPQLFKRFQNAVGNNMVKLHSGLTETNRASEWLRAQSGKIDVVVGTRSAVFVPLPRLGLIIVDEEHDLSFKQQTAYCYHARDIAIKQAQFLDIPIVLGSATPALESLYNVREKKYQLLQLSQRAKQATIPHSQLIDIRSHVLQNGLSTPLLKNIALHIERHEQVLLFINRRGYAPTLMCNQCGWLAQCQNCDIKLTLHHYDRRLRCHHCGYEALIPQVCPVCQQQSLKIFGQGTERVEETLAQYFPQTPILRIDRDSTQKRGSMEAFLDQIHSGEPHILIGTQMLAKGHDFPNVTLVGVLNGDHGFFSADFRGSERMAQLLIQVMGRAGRAGKAGKVYIQTYYPDHLYWRFILQHDYRKFSSYCLQERKETDFPPYNYMTLIKAEDKIKQKPLQFLGQVKQMLEQLITLKNLSAQCWGPIPATIERKGDRYRAQLIIQSKNRAALNYIVSTWVNAAENEKNWKKIRWSLDIDPMDMVN